ncbi:uncharacterized zinc-type alcohol dehydrogenase-like protein [Flavobacterium fryxellicola]|uniref:Hydroxyacid dehydrogenase n=1 Tax=Flavobacterium fryxellicola TaxID=249352 RepID=A0A168AGL6_9FLAO|nr:NAD(P)-dependent alcohol dehydrogenase [Flavobacterium fryxellicola]OAB31451.1 hydroxyacid dehydrogenase [Flavobacterium fryxellicola]SHN53653.1 uncharacterized zinc-type alcohol dehydrogenase-like protein [Flavobacterium fryxellicola]
MESTIVNDEGKKITTKAYGASGSFIGGKTLEKMEIERNLPKSDEVLIEILFCGICHSDIHQVNNDWNNTIYPCVPGHEIIGKIIQTGSGVHNYALHDIVGVGCMIDSCQHCKSCEAGEEQYCLSLVGPTMTYNGYFKADGSGFNTFGGFSSHIVVKENFLVSIPSELEISSAAPIVCAGVTTYSPLKHWGVKAGDTVGIIGIGGLGHMAVMIAKAMGATVTAITTSEDKRDAAMQLGADYVLLSDDAADMTAKECTFDFLLCTIPTSFDINEYINLLSPRGTIITVGLLGPYETATNNMDVAKYGRSIAGSLIGGIAETQEVLAFCATHQILPHVEIIKIQDVNQAFDHIKNQDIRFRYVIDMKSIQND